MSALLPTSFVAAPVLGGLGAGSDFLSTQTYKMACEKCSGQVRARSRLGRNKTVAAAEHLADFFWSPKGDELYYVTPNGEMMSVPVTLLPALKLGRPSKLFDWEKLPAARSGRPYDVSPVDGRFIMKKLVARNPDVPTSVSVVLNWSEDLRKRFNPH